MLNRYVGAGMALAYFPIMFRLSKTMKPTTCLLLTVGYGFAWKDGVKPFLTSRLQSSLNSSVSSFADKYKIKTDEHYL